MIFKRKQLVPGQAGGGSFNSYRRIPRIRFLVFPLLPDSHALFFCPGALQLRCSPRPQDLAPLLPGLAPYSPATTRTSNACARAGTATTRANTATPRTTVGVRNIQTPTHV